MSSHPLPEFYLHDLVGELRAQGIIFERGLSDKEFEAAETLHGFVFPPDLRRFLQFALPVGDGFPEWRHPECHSLMDRMAWPFEGMCFDIENNSFWLDAWGPRPEDLQSAFNRAHLALARAPTLIPVFIHRYLPASPSLPGNPVLSVHQTDIIYYGMDLPSYFSNEFGVRNPLKAPDSPRTIEFWTKLVLGEHGSTDS